MDRPIRVAQVIGMAIDGGTESLWMNYYRNIDRTKVQFDFLVESTSKIIRPDKIEALGGHVIFIPSYKNPFKYMKTLKKIFKDNKYDIVHSNMNALSVFTLRAAKKAGIKVRIAHSHSTSNKKEKLKNLIKNILRPLSKVYATHYFACSKEAAIWLFGKKNYEKGKTTIIKNAVEFDHFYYNEEVRSSIRKELELEGKFVIGNIGRFMPQKNQLFLIDIFYEFQKKHPNSALLFLGDGPLHEQLVQKTRDLKINYKVIFAGVHKHPERFYQAMDCFVFPSLYEGLGMTLIEAQINGLPCIASTDVPLEAKISNDIKFFSNKKSSNDWSEHIQFEIRKGNNDSIVNALASEYDIKKQASILCNIYIGMVGE